MDLDHFRPQRRAFVREWTRITGVQEQLCALIRHEGVKVRWQMLLR